MNPNCLLFSERVTEVQSKGDGVGWGKGSGGAMVLGKLLVPGRLTNLNNSRPRVYCVCSRCRWGCLNIFSLVYLFSFLSPSFPRETCRIN